MLKKLNRFAGKNSRPVERQGVYVREYSPRLSAKRRITTTFVAAVDLMHQCFPDSGNIDILTSTETVERFNYSI